MSKSKHPMCERTQKAREHSGIDASVMAAHLGVEYHAYNKYETRSPIRIDLIPAFCQLTGVRSDWLMTGSGEMKAQKAGTKEERIAYHLEELEREFKEDDFISPLLKSIKSYKEKQS